MAMLSKVRETLISYLKPAMIFIADWWTSGYECSNYEWCMSTIQGTVTITVTPDGTVVTAWDTVTLPNPNGDYSLEGELQTVANAQAIQIRFDTSETASLGITPVPTATSTANAANTSNISSSGLSQATKIAIGVAIPVIFLAFIAGIFLGFRVRGLRHLRHRKRHAHEIHGKPELDNRPATGQHEQGGEERSAGGVELGGEGRPAGGAELGGEGRPADRVELGEEERLVGGAELERPAGRVELGGEERPAGVVVYEAECTAQHRDS